MKIKITYMALLRVLISFFFLFWFDCSRVSGPEIEKVPPRILNIKARSNVLAINDTTTIICYANDPNDDSLVYIWDGSFGKIIGDGPEILWKASSLRGNDTIRCTVKDSDGKMDSSSIVIKVFWYISADSLNLVILSVDFLSYSFEGASLEYYPMYSQSPMDSFTFVFERVPYPGEWGSFETFLHLESLDTFFCGLSIWEGPGRIIYPKMFTSPGNFNRTNEYVPPPASKIYIIETTYLQHDVFKMKADSAWSSVHSLDVVKGFSNGDYHIAAYLFTPDVGGVDPYKARWIIFMVTQQ